MDKLVINEVPYGGMGLRTKKITGFKDGELDELKSMEHREAREKIVEMLDSRNGNQGTCWACGYGIYGVWFDNEAVYMNIGGTCD